MKTLVSILLVSLLATGVSLAVDVPNTTVQTEIIGVSVSQIEMLSAPARATVTLSVNCPDDANYGRSVLTQCDGAGLAFTQNSGVRKIVAQAVHDSGNQANDILMSCSVEDLAPAILVSNGQDTGPQDLWRNIAPGGYSAILTWTVDGSLAGTPSGDYAWTVTFTAMADD